MSAIIRWAVKWRSKNQLDGVSEHFIYGVSDAPVLYRTKREAQAWITKRYGYIATRKDLREGPHGWRVPKAVRVEVVLTEI